MEKKAGKMRVSFRAISILLSAALAVQSAGCSKPAANRTGEMGAIQKETVSLEKRTREYVWDFDAQVNDEWKAYAKKKADELHYAWYSKAVDDEVRMTERIRDILDNTDLSTLSPDSDLYKTIYVYRQLNDSKWRKKEAGKAIKKKLDRIERVRNLNDLYTLYRDREYEFCNLGMQQQVVVWEDGSTNYITARTVNDEYQKITIDQKKILKEYLVRLGYSGSRAEEIVKNASEMDKVVTSFLRKLSEESKIDFIDGNVLSEKKVQYPILDILKDLHAIDKKNRFIGLAEYCDFLNNYYKPENALKIRDHSIAAAAIYYARFDSEKVSKVFEQYFTYRSDNYDTSDLFGIMKDLANDVLSKEYSERYLDQEYVAYSQVLMEKLKASVWSIILDSDWLTTEGKVAAGRKIANIRCYLGENPHSDDFSEVVLTNDPLNNLTALRLSRDEFLDAQLQLEGEDADIYASPLLTVNGFYHLHLNALSVSGAFMEGSYNNGEPCLEEALASLGSVIAHEMSHAYDPSGIEFGDLGQGEAWLQEKESENYKKRTDKIRDFFDGMKVGEGCKLDGDLVCGETFADLMSVECCLRILARKENPDYDLFFKTYAQRRACYYTDYGLKVASRDEHLPDKERINYVLGQFDLFYEIYEVDPESPYYVPEEDRLPVF